MSSNLAIQYSMFSKEDWEKVAAAVARDEELSNDQVRELLTAMPSACLDRASQILSWRLLREEMKISRMTPPVKGKMPLAYAAGPGVFRQDAHAHGQSLKTVGLDYNVEVLHPLIDGSLPDGFEDASKKDQAEMIFDANVSLIERSDFVVADLNAFRGFEMDSGTAFEIGYAFARGKLVVGFMSDTTELIKNPKLAVHVKNDVYYDEFMRLIEDFGLPVNLMIGRSIRPNNIVQGDFEAALKHAMSLK